MHRGGGDFAGAKGYGYVNGPSRLRRIHNDTGRDEEEGEGEEGGGGRVRFDFSRFIDDPSPSSHDQPGSASGLRRHIVASLLQQRRMIGSNHRAIQLPSPASFGSSMELTPYNPDITSVSSFDVKGRAVHPDPKFSLKTSTELLKVLNRIWSLEEQHASNVSLIRALKMERDHARARIKELLRDQQVDRREIDTLMNQISEDKFFRESKEQDRLHTAVQSVRGELEDERKLRKRSESLHRKLARELSDAKTSLADALKEAERERKSRKLLEDLCDEFAVGIREYEHEVRSLKQKSDKEWNGNVDCSRLILHISESWLDERMQKVEEAQHVPTEKSSIAEKLSFEIESFLEAKRVSALDSANSKLPRERRLSLESVPLNEAVSAPQAVFNQEDSSTGNDSNFFELKRNGNSLKAYEDEVHDEDDVYQKLVGDLAKKKRTPRRKNKGLNVSAPSVKSEEKLNPNPVEIGVTTHDSEVHDRNKTSVLDDFVKGELTSGVQLHANVDGREACGSKSSAWRTQPSPVRQWTARLKSTDLDGDTSKLPPSSSRENTLKSKLMEARPKGQKSKSRVCVKFF